MNSSKPKHIRLDEVLDRTASTIEITDDGRLIGERCAKPTSLFCVELPYNRMQRTAASLLTGLSRCLRIHLLFKFRAPDPLLPLTPDVRRPNCFPSPVVQYSSQSAQDI